MTTIPADFVAIFLVGNVVVVSFAQIYIWIYFRVAASHKAFPRCYTRFIIQSSPSETVTPKNTPSGSAYPWILSKPRIFLTFILSFNLLCLSLWWPCNSDFSPSNNKTTGTLLLQNEIVSSTNLLDYWVLQMKRKKLKIMNWTKMIYLLTFFTLKWRIWMIEAILSRHPPAPCLEDVAGVACDTGAGAASSTSPWDEKTNQPLVQRAGNEKLCNSRVH